MKLKDGLYNEQVYMPKLKVRDVDVQLRYTYHALNAAETDKYGEIILPDSLNLTQAEVVEMEVVRGKPYKIVARAKYSHEYDLVFVILVDTLLVKTVWLNSKRDSHKTLRNPERFVQAPKRSK